MRMSYETDKDAAVAAYQAYTRAFLDNDMDAIDRSVRYPVAYLVDGKQSCWSLSPSSQLT